MRLPHRDPIQLGLTAYEVFQEKEGIPSVTGFFIEDLMDVEVKPWARMGALGSYLNMGEQQENDAYICEIPAGKQTEPQHHMFETLIYIHKGRGATTVWFEGDAKQTFEWAAGAIFAIPLNVSYQHFNVSNEPVRFLAGTNAPHVINLFHNEDFIFRNPFQFRDRFRPDREFFNENKKLTVRSWESNLVPDVKHLRPRRLSNEGQGREDHALRPGRHDLRLPRSGIPGGQPQPVSPPWSRRHRLRDPRQRLRDGLARRRGAHALRDQVRARSIRPATSCTMAISTPAIRRCATSPCAGAARSSARTVSAPSCMR